MVANGDPWAYSKLSQQMELWWDLTLKLTMTAMAWIIPSDGAMSLFQYLSSAGAIRENGLMRQIIISLSSRIAPTELKILIRFDSIDIPLLTELGKSFLA